MRSKQQHAPGCEGQLIYRAIGGSFAAFEELVYVYEQRIYGFVFQYCRNEQDAKEITQDTFLRAFQALNQFNLKYPFGPWLFAIARRKCIDFHRTREPASSHEVPDVADARDPSSVLSQREDRENLWSLARTHLSRLEFHVLWLKYVEDMDVREIATVVGKSRTHVKVILFRARNALGKEIQTRRPEGSSAPPRAIVRPGAAPLSAVII